MITLGSLQRSIRDTALVIYTISKSFGNADDPERLKKRVILCPLFTIHSVFLCT